MGDRVGTIESPLSRPRAARGGHAIERLAPASVVVLVTLACCYLTALSLDVGTIGTGALYALLACLFIVAAGVSAIAFFERRLTRRAAAAERRRIGRDIHDGLAQELAFVCMLSQQLSVEDSDAAKLTHLQTAAERALQESRTTIAMLTAPNPDALDGLLESVANTFHSRFGVQVDLDVEGVAMDRDSQNALLRIVHEASHNAVRHGDAHRIQVGVHPARRGTVLSVADDGVGFDVSAAGAGGGGLGLTSMRERAELIGGRFELRSAPGRGTVIEVELP